ncbi:MAG: N-acetylglucosamine-6-phosphate deacetylase [Erysipelotrichaceae bacterium]
MKIKSRRVYLEEKFQEACIEIENGVITSIIKGGEEKVDFDYGSLRILPGFIDIHCHGYNMMAINSATYDGLVGWMKRLPMEGVTSFLPSSSTAPEEGLLKAFNLVSKIKDENIIGTQILGINVEGPQISFTHNGAQNPYYIQKPNIDQFKRYQKAANGIIKLITIAPEMDEQHSLIKYCTANGIKVSLGHSGATYEEANKAIEDGACSITHTFNGMTQMEHRAPGVVGAAMINDKVYAELISDGIHVHSGACKILARCKGKDKLILVSDSAQIKGLNPGVYETSGRTLIVAEDGSVRLENGKLAGSTNAINILVKRAIEDMGIDEVTVFNAATINPANLLDCNNKGKLEVGRDGDIVVLNDDYTVRDVFLLGDKFN